MVVVKRSLGQGGVTSERRRVLVIRRRACRASNETVFSPPDRRAGVTDALFVSVGLGPLHVLQRLAVLTVLSVHAHACHDEGRDTAGDAEAPVNAGVHG